MRCLGVEQVLKLGDKRYRLGRFTLSLLRRWLDWATDTLGTPIQPADLAALSLEAVEDFENLAATWHTLQNPYIRDLYASEEGREQIWALLFDRYHWRIDPAPLLDLCPDPDGVIERAGGKVVPTDLEVQETYLACIGKWGREDDEPEPMDWDEQFRSMFTNLYLRPHDVGDMTLAEIITVARGKPSQDAMLGLAAGYSKLKPEQKKDMAILRIETLLR